MSPNDEQVSFYHIELSNGGQVAVPSGSGLLASSDTGSVFLCDAADLEPGMRLAPPSEIPHLSADAPGDHPPLRAYALALARGGAAAAALSAHPGDRIRRWRDDHGDGKVALNLMDLVQEMECGVGRQTVLEWERNWRLDFDQDGKLSLSGGPEAIGHLFALAEATDLPEVYAVLAGRLAGATLLACYYADPISDDEASPSEQRLLERALRDRMWMEAHKVARSPAWWPMVVAVQPFVQPAKDQPAPPQKTLVDTLATQVVRALFVAQQLENQGCVADNRTRGGALWIYLPAKMSLAGWKWTVHHNVGRAGLYSKADSPRVELVNAVAVAYASKFGDAGLAALLRA